MTARIGGGLLLALLAAGCKSQDSGPSPLRLGFFPNITHAQALVGAADGTFQRELGEVPLETKLFNAGPPAMEAMIAGNLDVCYVGPTPATIGFVRSGGKVKVIAGAASGGAVLVVRDATGPGDLKGKKVASPQIGNTQDVALRFWLRSQGLNASDTPGRDLTVLPIANSDILSLFKRGEIAAAWVPEPWGARLVNEAGGKVLIDERDLWPGGEFPTTLLVATEKALKNRRPEVLAIVRAHQALTHRWRKDPSAFQVKVNDAFQARTGKRLPDEVLGDAFSRMSLTTDLLEPQLLEEGRRTIELGYLPKTDLEGMVDPSLLAEVGKNPS